MYVSCICAQVTAHVVLVVLCTGVCFIYFNMNCDVTFITHQSLCEIAPVEHCCRTEPLNVELTDSCVWHNLPDFVVITNCFVCHHHDWFYKSSTSTSIGHMVSQNPPWAKRPVLLCPSPSNQAVSYLWSCTLFRSFFLVMPFFDNSHLSSDMPWPSHYSLHFQYIRTISFTSATVTCNLLPCLYMRLVWTVTGPHIDYCNRCSHIVLSLLTLVMLAGEKLSVAVCSMLTRRLAAVFLLTVLVCSMQQMWLVVDVKLFCGTLLQLSLLWILMCTVVHILKWSLIFRYIHYLTVEVELVHCFADESFG